MAIRILVTGGTFDKEYDEVGGKLFFKDTHLQEMLGLGRCKLDVALRTLMMVDSLEMTDADRSLIVEQCKHTKERKIVITHGTDTMEVTAQTLGKTINDKTIVLTGAMVPKPAARMDSSISAAPLHCPDPSPGVYRHEWPSV
jgi:L-asparaginase